MLLLLLLVLSVCRHAARFWLLINSRFVCVDFQVCAIVGGTFTVAGIIDSMIFTASELFKKAQLGKLS